MMNCLAWVSIENEDKTHAVTIKCLLTVDHTGYHRGWWDEYEHSVTWRQG